MTLVDLIPYKNENCIKYPMLIEDWLKKETELSSVFFLAKTFIFLAKQKITGGNKK